MKNVINALFVLVLCLAAAGAFAKQKEKAFSGIVIFYSDELVELKKGKTELKLYRDAATVIENKSTDASQSSLALCQKAKAWYVVEQGKAKLVKLEITAPGYCGN